MLGGDSLYNLTYWFDKEEINPDYYSVMDKIADLQQNPKAAAIVGEIIAKGKAARGKSRKARITTKTCKNDGKNDV